MKICILSAVCGLLVAHALAAPQSLPADSFAVFTFAKTAMEENK